MLENDYKDNFSKTFLSDHPQRRLHILLSILALVLVAGSVVYYQMSKIDYSDNKTAVMPVIENQSQVSLQQQKDKAIADLAARSATNPSIPQSMRDKAILDLNKRLKK